MKIAFIVISIVEALIIAVLLIIMLKKKSSQNKIIQNAESIVKGKLDVEDVKTDGSDANAVILANAFNAIKTNLMTFVETTKVNVITLSDAIDVLSESVDANSKGNEQIAEGATNVAIKTAEQLELVKENLSIIDSNNDKMQEIDESIRKIKEALDDTVGVSKNGLSNLEGYEKDMHAMSSDLNNINEILTEFNQEIQRIGEVGKFIVGISDQLRLLAFNASIEAARAGQAGRGFTVVADEMNVMSSKTREGVNAINEILNKIIKSSELVNSSISNCETTYNRSIDTFESVNKSFRAINEHSININEKMSDISTMFDSVAVNSDESKKKAESLFEAAQSISENTHEIAAVSEEVSAESSKIGENTIALSGMLEGIQNLLKQFNTAIVPTEKTRAQKVKILALSRLDNDFWYGVRKGIFYAQKELAGKNVLIEYNPLLADGDELDPLVSELVRYAIDNDFDGITFPGFLGGSNKEFKEAARHGIKLMSYNCDCSKEIPRIACLRPDPIEPGVIGAKCAAKQLNKRGNILMLTGDLSVGVNVERSTGFKKELGNYSGMKIVDEIIIPDDADGVYRLALAGLKNNPDTNLIYITNGFPMSAVRAVKDAGKRGKVTVVSYDHNQEIFRAIKEGYISAAIGQDTFGQGHDPIIWLYNHIVAGDKLDEYINCKLNVVDKSNVANLIEA